MSSPVLYANACSTSNNTEEDFYRCLERIDLLFQHYYLREQGIPPTNMQAFFLPEDFIALRLQYPEGKPHWMRDDVALPLNDSNDLLSQRLASLMRYFDLNEYERDILLIGLLPRFSSHYVTLLRQLLDTQIQGAMTRDLLLNVLCHTHTQYHLVQSALHPASLLLNWRLLAEKQDTEPSQRTFLAVHRAVWHFLSGGDMLIADCLSAVRQVHPESSGWYPPALQAQLQTLWLQDGETDFPLLIIEGQYQDGRENAVANIMANQGISTLCIDITRLGELPSARQADTLTTIFRDAILYQCCLMLENVGAPSGSKTTYSHRLEMLLQSGRLPVALLTDKSADLPGFSHLVSVQIGMTPPSAEEKATLLSQAIPAHSVKMADLLTLCRRHHFSVAALPLIVQEADYYRKIRGGHDTLALTDLQQTLNRRSRKNFGNLARRITPQRTFDDLILSPALKEQMAEIIAAIRWRESVTEQHFKRKLGGNVGISALFYGESGTGKTLAAEVLAHHLSTDLIKVDLSNVVNKYIGETEKNLARIFDLAESDSGVLFFDEADALFGKRSETKDAHDRHANIEVSYLLQRLESYPGLIILATNNRSHLDSAFNRRFTFITRFTYPDAALREQLWHSIWPESLTLSDDIDFTQLAARTELTGANIRNVALLAALIATEDNSHNIQSRHIEQAVRRELGKLGRLML